MSKSPGIGSTIDNIFDNAINPTSAAAAEILNLIEKMKRDWNHYEFRDDNLWKTYFDYFERYIEDDFNQIDKNQLREFRSYFRKRGVWMQTGPRILCSIALANILKEDKPDNWTENELKRCRRKGFIFLELLDRIKRINKNDSNYQKNPTTFAFQQQPSFQSIAPNLQIPQQQQPFQSFRQFTSFTSQPQQFSRQLTISIPSVFTYAAATSAIFQPSISSQQFAFSYVITFGPAASGSAFDSKFISATIFIFAFQVAFQQPRLFKTSHPSSLIQITLPIHNRTGIGWKKKCAEKTWDFLNW